MVPSAAPPTRIRFASRSDWFEIVALTALLPVSWLTPQSWWPPLARAFSLAIAWSRPRITRKRVATLASALGPRVGDHPRRALRALRVAIMDGYMEERLQILREYRPRGWRFAVRTIGREHLDAARAAGRGAVLWIAPFAYGDLVPKVALARAGVALHHLSAFSRGFSPNSCYPWTPTRLGMNALSPLRTAVEDRYLAERIVIPPGGGLGYARTVERRLRAGEIVSIRAGDTGHRSVAARFLGGSIRLASGPASLALATGAALLPVFCIRTGAGSFDLVIEPPLAAPAGVRPHRAAEMLVARYARTLERWTLRHPSLWSGWYQMDLGDAAADDSAAARAVS